MDVDEIDKLLSPNELCSLLAVSRTTLCRYQQDEDFPKPIMLGPQTKRWVQFQVKNWLLDKLSSA